MNNFIPYGRQSIDSADVEAVAEVLRSDWLTTGPVIGEFERALSSVSGGHPVVAMASGTAALHAAYHAAGIGPGKVLLTTPLTFASTASVALHLGAKLRFADVDDNYLTLDPDAVAASWDEKVTCVTTVDFAGGISDVEGLSAVVGDAVLIEDASHSLGGSFRGRPVGDLADLTTYSFHPVKTITTGEGGAVVTRRKEYEPKLRRFIDHGLIREKQLQRRPDEGDWHQEMQTLGLNYRLPDILAALGISQLRKLEQFAARRTYLFDRYVEALGDVPGILLPTARPESRPTWHLFPIRITSGRRKEVYDSLRSAGVGVQVHYLPVHMHPLFEDLGFKRGMFPVAESAYEQLLSLPLFPGLAEDAQDRVIELLQDIMGRG